MGPGRPGRTVLPVTNYPRAVLGLGTNSTFLNALKARVLVLALRSLLGLLTSVSRRFTIFITLLKGLDVLGLIN